MQVSNKENKYEGACEGGFSNICPHVLVRLVTYVFSAMISVIS